LDHYLSGEQAVFDSSQLIQPMLFVSLALVAAGIGLGVLLYRRAGATDPLEQALPGPFRFLANRMWLDELYGWTIIAFARTTARASDLLDRYFWDGLVRAIGALGGTLGSLTKGFDERGINAGVDDATNAARGFGREISARHSGQVQTYLGAIAVGMLALLILYAWLT
jgi:NADH-quinone oxidoreductase subunit L